jgi:hypothetical protein
MDYLEEIKPYIQHVQLYNQGKGSPNYEIKLKLSDIYNRLRKQESVTIYGSSNAQIPDTDLGCSSCVSTMMNDLEKWYNHKLKTVSFKGVPDKKPESKTNDLDSMKWGEFKTYCKSKGIEIKSKTRVELMDELKNL